jgi:hypothetical protein
MAVKTMNPALWYVLGCGHVRPNTYSWWNTPEALFTVWGNNKECVPMICQQTYPDDAFKKTPDPER